MEDGISSSFEASIAGTDPSRDIAVLKTSATPELSQPIHIGTSADLRIGQFVFAIGNPSGLSRSQTCGVVSGLNRSIPSPTGVRIPGVIQTDAPINAGALQLSVTPLSIDVISHTAPSTGLIPVVNLDKKTV
jgi:S1-C subfamily serine protease